MQAVPEEDGGGESREDVVRRSREGATEEERGSFERAKAYVEEHSEWFMSWYRYLRKNFLQHMVSIVVCGVLLTMHRHRAAYLTSLISTPADCIMNLWLWQYFLTKEELHGERTKVLVAGIVVALGVVEAGGVARRHFNVGGSRSPLVLKVSILGALDFKMSELSHSRYGADLG